MKPEECNYCNNKDLILLKNQMIFNPDTDEEELYERVYKCETCGTLHVNNKDIKFIQREINKNKLLQINDNCNITIN